MDTSCTFLIIWVTGLKVTWLNFNINLANLWPTATYSETFYTTLSKKYCLWKVHSTPEYRVVQFWVKWESCYFFHLLVCTIYRLTYRYWLLPRIDVSHVDMIREAGFPKMRLPTASLSTVQSLGCVLYSMMMLEGPYDLLFQKGDSVALAVQNPISIPQPCQWVTPGLFGSPLSQRQLAHSPHVVCSQGSHKAFRRCSAPSWCPTLRNDQTSTGSLSRSRT